MREEYDEGLALQRLAVVFFSGPERERPQSGSSDALVFELRSACGLHVVVFKRARLVVGGCRAVACDGIRIVIGHRVSVGRRVAAPRARSASGRAVRSAPFSFHDGRCLRLRGAASVKREKDVTWPVSGAGGAPERGAVELPPRTGRFRTSSLGRALSTLPRDAPAA